MGTFTGVLTGWFAFGSMHATDTSLVTVYRDNKLLFVRTYFSMKMTLKLSNGFIQMG